MNIEERLLSIKKQIEKAKTDKAQLEGRLATQYERLKELGCNDIKAAQKKVDALNKEATMLENEVEKGLKKFEEEYGF